MLRPASLFLALAVAAPLAAQDADLDLMMRYVEGRFDNHLQVWQQGEDGVADSLRHAHVHAVFARVEAPTLGDHVVHVQQSLGSDPDRVRRQRLYAFARGEGPDAGHVVLTIYAFPDDAVRDGPLDSALLARLTPETLRPRPGCDMVWTREGDAFRGETRDGACPPSHPGPLRVAEDVVYLDADEVWTGGHPTTAPYRLRRADVFTGWAVLRADGSESVEPAPDSAFIMVGDLSLHDEGQRQRLVTADGRDLGVTVELAQLVYQASRTAILKLALYRDGEDRAFAYTWADPDAGRIGLNLRWVQVGLTRDGGRP